MALIKCPECGRQVSDRADKCPDCAYPLNQDITASSEAVKSGTQRSKASYDIGSAVALVGIIVAVLLGFATGSLWAGLILAVAALSGGVWIQYKK